MLVRTCTQIRGEKPGFFRKTRFLFTSPRFVEQNLSISNRVRHKEGVLL
jgi:hypothetical protein